MREGSLSFKRALGATQASPRLKNAEGSAFGLLRTNGSVQSNRKMKNEELPKEEGASSIAYLDMMDARHVFPRNFPKRGNHHVAQGKNEKVMKKENEGVSKSQMT